MFLQNRSRSFILLMAGGIALGIIYAFATYFLNYDLHIFGFPLISSALLVILALILFNQNPSISAKTFALYTGLAFMLAFVIRYSTVSILLYHDYIFLQEKQYQLAEEIYINNNYGRETVSNSTLLESILSLIGEFLLGLWCIYFGFKIETNKRHPKCSKCYQPQEKKFYVFNKGGLYKAIKNALKEKSISNLF